MRIIRGIYGRRTFRVPPGFSARPTTDFARENLFNVLDNLLEWDGQCGLDLFSGTGGIAFEMLSRGCLGVTAVESNPLHAAFIRKVAAELKTDALRLVRGDAIRFIRNARAETFDLIFADPPYALDMLADLPRLIFRHRLLRPDGIFVLEHPAVHDFSPHPRFDHKRTYGSVNFSIFRNP